MNTTTVKLAGSSDYGHARPICTCGWKGPLYSRRFAESRTLAERDADHHERAEHAKRPLAERMHRLLTQGARFELLPGEHHHRHVAALIGTGVARTFRDGGTWLELAD